ncbi:MAG TPA: hypothetical protein VGC54_06630 [Planctomycetota bacterium]
MLASPARSSILPGALAAVLLASACQAPRPMAGVTESGAELAAATWMEAANWQPLQTDAGSSLRGICVVDADVVWASGTGGRWLRTLDGGRTWSRGHVAEAKHLDFRDVHAIDADTAWLMAAGPGDASGIWRTEDGGASWKLHWRNPQAEGFYDGMAFWDDDNGLLFGDPVDGEFQVMRTADGGRRWAPAPAPAMPRALEGEHAFAASGTGIAVWSGERAWFVTGGSVSRVFRSDDRGASWTAAENPLGQGLPGAGAFSVAFRDAHNGVVVGGNYERPDSAHATAAWTDDGGRTWHAVPTEQSPRGYRSAVAFLPGTSIVVAVGTSGSDWSADGGRTWRPLGARGFHAVAFAPAHGTGAPLAFAVGGEGSAGRLEPARQ